MSSEASESGDARHRELAAELVALREDRERLSRELESERERLSRALESESKARAKAEHEREQFRKLYTLVQYELERLKRQLFGQKAERVDPAQVQLVFGPVLDALERAREGDPDAASDVERQLAELRERAQDDVRRRGKPATEKKPHGRRDLSLEDLPVTTIVLEPAERQAEGGELLVKIGEEVSEHVDRRPASLVRVRVVRPKYKSPDADAETRIAIAEMPERPIPRGSAGPGLLAHVLVQKFADHIPLHRQESIFAREGFALPRSTLSGWVQGTTSLLSVVVDAMWKDAVERAAWIAIDATGALVLAKERCRRGHFWVVVAARDHVLFRFTKTGDGKEPLAMLDGYRGPVIADASSVYHELYRQNPEITEVGCWSHARRNFFDALPSDRERALVGIGFIGLLYEAHRGSMDAAGIVDAAARRAATEPVLRDLDAWIASELPTLAEGTPIRRAMQYVINHAVPLRRFQGDGGLRLDNNVSELQLRREVLGRKNWLFCGSDDGAHWNTIAVSLIASCELHGVEPWAYLRDVITLLPAWPKHRALELSPKLWKQTAEQHETRQRLASSRLLGRGEDSGHDGEGTGAG